MAEKPRLKESDEIFGSIATSPARASKRTVEDEPHPARQGRRGKDREPEIRSMELLTEEDEAVPELPEPPALPSAQELAEKLLARDERRALDFGKYELNRRHAKTAEPGVAFELIAEKPPAPATAATPETNALPVAPPPKNRARQPVQEAPKKAPRAVREELAEAALEEKAPLVKEFTFPSFEEEETPVREFRVEREPRQKNTAAEEKAPREKPRRKAQERPKPEPGPEPEAAAEPEFAPAPARRRRAAEALLEAQADEEDGREEFIKRISSKFEQDFTKIFEDDLLPVPEIRQREEPAAPATAEKSPKSTAKKAERAEAEDDYEDAGEDDEAEPEKDLRPGPEEEAAAQDFLTRFRQDVRAEEQAQAEDFKETLAQKFMRERERYLKELGITEEEMEEASARESAAAVAESEPEASARLGREKTAQPPARRKLDFQIQPEMHMQSGAAPPAPRPAEPVTYTRQAAVKPQVAVEDPIANMPTEQGKKSGEELLMELVRNTPAQNSHLQRTPAQKPPAQFKFTFSGQEEKPEPKDKQQKKEKKELLPEEKWPRRIVMIAMCAGVLALALLIVPLVRLFTPPPEDALNLPEDLAPLASSVEEDTLSVYESRSFSLPAHVNNVLFKNANVTLKNAVVEEYVVVEAISLQGNIRLEDVVVNGAVSVKSAAIDSLELHNVQAKRVVINNPAANMTITATGTTDVGVVEIRTPATVRQIELAGDAAGVRGVSLVSASDGAPVQATLDGLKLDTLAADAAQSTLRFENGTKAETASVDGSLTLTGSGKVQNLAIGAKTGQGAGDEEDIQPVNLVVKDVEIGGISVKSPANLNLATHVDYVAAADAVNIGGDGSLGSLTLNPRVGSGRLLVDIAGLTIQSLYVNTQARINVTGSAIVNMLTADESAYALGNKVNHLVVNADGVIYENEPDNITVASGVRPPQTKAENPNIDYKLGAASGLLDTTEEEFATTCGHPRESGGFLVGDGSKDNPFEVSTPAQLAHVSLHLSSYFKQTADIDIASDASFSGGFAMIASAGNPFAGVYDGMGYAISNLRIISADENVGLFAENGGTIQNLHLVSGDVSASAGSQAYVGAIAGLNREGGVIRSCSNGAAVTGNKFTYTGGVVGYNLGARIQDCFNYAKISGAGTVGGLAGMNRQGAQLAGSYNAGMVAGQNDVGAVAGNNDGATIANCYYLAGSADAGIGAGAGTATEKTSEEMQEEQMAADLAAGNENSLWTMGGGNYAFPVLKAPE